MGQGWWSGRSLPRGTWLLEGATPGEDPACGGPGGSGPAVPPALGACCRGAELARWARNGASGSQTAGAPWQVPIWKLRPVGHLRLAFPKAFLILIGRGCCQLSSYLVCSLNCVCQVRSPGSWVIRGAPTRARGPGLPRGADSPPGLRLLLSFREAWGLTTRARCKVPCAECLSCCCWEGRAGDGEVGRPGWEVPLEPQA